MLSTVKMWMPNGRPHFEALLDAARDLARSAGTLPACVAWAASRPTRGADFNWVAGGVVAYSIRAVEGPMPRRAD